MFAPAALSSRVMACLSASETPGTGAGSNAEPPPERRQKQRSFGPSDETISRILSVPVIPSVVGSLIPAGRAAWSRMGGATGARQSARRGSGVFGGIELSIMGDVLPPKSPDPFSVTQSAGTLSQP